MTVAAPIVGEVLNASTGTWTNTPTSFAYQWLSCDSGGANCVPISPPATASAYTIVAGDSAHTIRVIVTATNAAGSAAQTSAQTGVVTGSGFTVPTSPAVIANSYDGADNNAPDNIYAITAVPAGGALFCCDWNENAHCANFIDTSGVISGPVTGLSGGQPGFFGICSDGTYLYIAARTGVLKRANLSGGTNAWSNPANDTSFDPMTGSGVGILTVSGTYLLDCICTGTPPNTYVYVIDSNSGTDPSSASGGYASPILRKIGPISSGSWGSSVNVGATIPYARRLCFDRQGFLWVLSQPSNGNPAGSNRLYRINASTGAQVPNSPWSVPGSIGYARDIACDLTTDRLYIPDNGPDQQIKVLSYDNTNATAPTVTGTIGQQAGYLNSSNGTRGTVGPLRFAGLVGCSLDASGRMYIAQLGNPQVGDRAWSNYGNGCIVSCLNAGFTTEAWRVSSGWTLGGNASVTSDWSKAYTKGWRYANVAGQFGGTLRNPDAFTIDPADDWEGRLNETYAGMLTVRDNINPGTRYVVYINQSAELTIYQEIAAILKPRVFFDMNGGQIITNNVAASHAPNIPYRDMCMDDVGNVWVVGTYNGVNGIFRFRLQGFQGDGTPNYNWSNFDTYAWPPAIGGNAWVYIKQIEVSGPNIWVAGFTADDYPTGNFDFNKQIGHNIVKYTRPNPGWSAPVWAQKINYTNVAAPTYYGNYPSCFAVDTVNSVVVIGYKEGVGPWTGAWMQVLNDSDGTLHRTIGPPIFPSKTGAFDQYCRSINCANGWVWTEEVYAIKTVGIRLP